jgi:phage I-like protein
MLRVGPARLIANLDANVVVLRGRIPMVSADAPKSWIDVAMVGEWRGYHDGEFQFTREIFSQIIKNFEGQTNPIPVDYEHQLLANPPVKAEAAGWIHELKVENDHLVALVEWTEDAAELIRKGKYKFNSPVVDFKAKHRKSGKPIGAELHSVAVTNAPFIDAQMPLAASRLRARGREVVAMGMVKSDLLTKIKAAFNDLPDDLDPGQVEGVVKAIIDLEAAKSGVGSTDDAAAEEAAKEASVADAALSDKPSADAVALGVDPIPNAATGAFAEELAALIKDAASRAGITFADDAALLAIVRDKLDAIVAALSGTNANGSAAEMSNTPAVQLTKKLEAAEQRIVALNKRVAEFESKDEGRAKKAIEEQVDALIAAGKALDAERPHLVQLARTDPDTFARWTATRPQVVPVKEAAPEGKPTESNDLTLSEEQQWAVLTFKQCGWNETQAIQMVRKTYARNSA